MQVIWLKREFGKPVCQPVIKTIVPSEPLNWLPHAMQSTNWN